MFTKLKRHPWIIRISGKFHSLKSTRLQHRAQWYWLVIFEIELQLVYWAVSKYIKASLYQTKPFLMAAKHIMNLLYPNGAGSKDTKVLM